MKSSIPDNRRTQIYLAAYQKKSSKNYKIDLKKRLIETAKNCLLGITIDSALSILFAFCLILLVVYIKTAHYYMFISFHIFFGASILTLIMLVLNLVGILCFLFKIDRERKDIINYNSNCLTKLIVTKEDNHR